LEQFTTGLASIVFEGSDVSDTRAALDAELTDALAELEVYRDQRVRDALSIETWADGLRVRQDRVDDLMTRMAQLAPLKGGGELASLVDELPGMAVEDQRAMLASSIDAVMLKRGRVPVDERALVLWAGELPDSVPKRGRRLPITSFKWPPR
jgi:hypothetical protein